jgi:hypothetical protein
MYLLTRLSQEGGEADAQTKSFILSFKQFLNKFIQVLVKIPQEAEVTEGKQEMGSCLQDHYSTWSDLKMCITHLSNTY